MLVFPAAYARGADTAHLLLCVTGNAVEDNSGNQDGGPRDDQNDPKRHNLSLDSSDEKRVGGWVG